MRTLRLVLAVLVTGALVGGAVGAVTAESEESEAMVFPTGMLVSVESNDMLLEFNEDGTGLVHAAWSCPSSTRPSVTSTRR